MAKRISVSLNSLFTIDPIIQSSMTPNLPKPCSIRTFLTYYCDLTSITKKSFLELCFKYAFDNLEKEKLQLLISTTPEGKVIKLL
jgi:NADPH-ferrihemoprotein reductase